MRAENFDINDVIDYLQGSTNWIESALGPDGILNKDFTPKYPDMTEDDLTDEDYMAIDNCIALCPSCGWWVESHEMGSTVEGAEDVCDDCADEYGGREE